MRHSAENARSTHYASSLFGESAIGDTETDLTDLRDTDFSNAYLIMNEANVLATDPDPWMTTSVNTCGGKR